MVVSFYYLFNTIGPETVGPYYVPAHEKSLTHHYFTLNATFIPSFWVLLTTSSFSQTVA
jgi:hypothetical protein